VDYCVFGNEKCSEGLLVRAYWLQQESLDAVGSHWLLQRCRFTAADAYANRLGWNRTKEKMGVSEMHPSAFWVF